jgi:hypothetical protein
MSKQIDLHGSACSGHGPLQFEQLVEVEALRQALGRRLHAVEDFTVVDLRQAAIRNDVLACDEYIYH